MRDLDVRRLSPADAEVISRWRYPGRYALYDGTIGPESVRYVLDPRNGFHSIHGPSGLVGFCSFGADGRVPGGTYDDSALDVGAGMDPVLVGGGNGRAFLAAIVAHASTKLGALSLRVTIASRNERALRAWRSVGFLPIVQFRSDQGADFTILVREAGDSDASIS